MNRIIFGMMALAAALIAAPPALAQQTTGNITGRIVDAQGAAIPGVTVTANNAQTGFSRSDVSDAEGIYRLNLLPVGTYDIAAELAGFNKLENKGVVVNVGQSLDIGLTLTVASVQESVTVTGQTPLIETRTSSVGGVVDVARIESLPLNGRQFANLAATVPGVGLGFHSDPTKSSQFSPQINGGNGRNVNYQIDGGDNNDDTVGGLLQNFPLEAIQEFNFVTQRFKAEYGRSNGGVMNIVTKSGTNELRGSAFTLMRDKSLNGRTFSEEIAGRDKSDYRRYQFGGSVGGPILHDRAHFFGAFERTQQDTRQTVDTRGLFPSEDGVYDTLLRENLLTAKATSNLSPAHYVAVRYGRNTNSQPYGAALRSAPSAWSTSKNSFNSINANHNWVVGGSKLNEFIFQYADFRNHIPQSSEGVWHIFPNGVRAGANPNTPQTTEQKKWQFRNDFTWSVTGMGGIGHDFKAGANWIHEPHLFITFNGGADPSLTYTADTLDAPIRQVTFLGGAADVNIPMDLYAFYLQDDWRVNNRLTLNLGLRYDLVDGLLDQSSNPNFIALQAAGQAGRFANFPFFEDFGQSPQNDKDNIQPRIGFAYDVQGNGRNVVRGGWGIYTDFGYTNSNVLFPALDSAGGHGNVFFVSNAAGIRRADGEFFTAADPLSTIEHLNQVPAGRAPLLGQVASPRLEQPYTRQTNLGWAHQLNASTAVTVDYVRVEGRDINIRFRPNTLENGTNRLADLALRPNTIAFRTAVSKGQSTYDGLIVGLRRRMSSGFDLSASYTLGRADSMIGTANDELDANIIQDARNPLDAINQGPSTRTDARHRLSISAVIRAPLGIQVAPFFLYRSGLPLLTFEGIDTNGDGNVNDITASAYRYAGLNDDGSARFEEDGACESVNCSRRAPFSQLNLRVSRGFRLWGTARVEAIGEVFNLLNAKNPALPLTSQRVNTTTGAGLAAFMQPVAYAGDFQQPEQRVGQVGFRFTF
ncbi:MAG TPA: carboxypeptidase regulatory-like domain-containing protein [Vicinamibacterales bacterium]|nr:carboxypeptidase regulatory-like domain-containing protein [Vicinamibacterales bacterium]